MGIKRVLQCFQLLSGFKINFKKSSLFVFKQSQHGVDVYASMLGCKIDTGPISYLGATLGANPRSVRFWDPLIHKFSAKINSYDASRVSLAGKTVLLRAAIDNIPIYWFSMYRMPEMVANKLE